MARRISRIASRCISGDHRPSVTIWIVGIVLVLSEPAAGSATFGCGTTLPSALPNEPVGRIGTPGEPGGTAGGCAPGIGEPPWPIPPGSAMLIVSPPGTFAPARLPLLVPLNAACIALPSAASATPATMAAGPE